MHTHRGIFLIRFFWNIPCGVNSGLKGSVFLVVLALRLHHGLVLHLLLVVSVLDGALLLALEVDITPPESALGGSELVVCAKIKFKFLGLDVEFHADGVEVEVVPDDTLLQHTV